VAAWTSQNLLWRANAEYGKFWEVLHLAIVLDYLFDDILSQRFVRTLMSLGEWAVTVAICLTIYNDLHLWHLFPADYKWGAPIIDMRADKATFIIPLI